MFQNLRPFAISFLIGLFIGIERERSHPTGMQPMGVRTFVLLALLGTLAALMNEPSLTVSLSLFAFGTVLLGYFRSTRFKHHADIGITTEVAAGVVFGLGYTVLKEPLLSAILGVVVLILLFGRDRLHSFSRKKLTPDEIQATITILIIVLVVLPFLPDRSIDPWHLFNPRLFGMFVTIIAVMQFAGYIAVRVFGHRLGMLLTGYFGGLISSTVVFATLPGVYREQPQLLRPCVVAGIFSVLGMLTELCVILLTASSQLFIGLLPNIFVIMLVGGLSGLLMINRTSEEAIINGSSNPLDIKSVLRLAVFIGGMLILIGIAQHYVGETGIRIVAFLGGLFELHSVTLAVVALFLAGKLTQLQANEAIMLAVAATFVSKFILLWTLSRNRFAMITSFFLLLMLSAGVAMAIYVPVFG